MRHDDHIPEISAADFHTAEAAEREHLFRLDLSATPHAPRRPDTSVTLLECTEAPGELFTIEAVALLMEVPAETVKNAIELRDGVIEGLHFKRIKYGYRRLAWKMNLAHASQKRWNKIKLSRPRPRGRGTIGRASCPPLHR